MLPKEHNDLLLLSMIDISLHMYHRYDCSGSSVIQATAERRIDCTSLPTMNRASLRGKL